MKLHPLLLSVALFSACSTAQLNQAEAITNPIVAGVVSTYAAQYGIPPTVTTPIVNAGTADLWGAVSMLFKGQPVASGAASPAVGAAIAANLPGGSAATQASAITNAIAILATAKLGTPVAAPTSSAWPSKRRGWFSFWRK
jgi:hypothetical protein